MSGLIAPLIGNRSKRSHTSETVPSYPCLRRLCSRKSIHVDVLSPSLTLIAVNPPEVSRPSYRPVAEIKEARPTFEPSFS